VSKEPLETVTRVWEAAQRRDTDALFALYDPAIVWQVHYGPIELRGVYHGHEGVRQLFKQWREPFETYEEEPGVFIDAGDNVVVEIRLSGRGKTSGVEVEMPRWMMYTIRDGLVIRVDIFETKAEALEAAGLQQ
jgi:ketosteroid isomerase-like protein